MDVQMKLVVSNPVDLLLLLDFPTKDCTACDLNMIFWEASISIFRHFIKAFTDAAPSHLMTVYENVTVSYKEKNQEDWLFVRPKTMV